MVAATTRTLTRRVERAAQPLEFLLLQNTQQLRLQFERNIADLIQEQRAAIRRFETAQLLRHRARKGPFFMAEELALQESQRNRRAVQSYERPVPALAVGVNGLRDEFFTRARFALDENGRVGWGDRPNLIQDLTKHCARSHDTCKPALSFSGVTRRPRY